MAKDPFYYRLDKEYRGTRVRVHTSTYTYEGWAREWHYDQHAILLYDAERDDGQQVGPVTINEPETVERIEPGGPIREIAVEAIHPSPYSAREFDTPAGRLGLPYCFAAFIRPDAAPQAFEAYRENFEPAPFEAAPDEPAGMIGANVSCGDTDEEAARLRASVEAYYQRLDRGEVGTPPAVDDAIDELGGVPDPTPRSVEPGDWPQQISGSPATVRSLLERMTEQVGVDEVVIQNLIPDPEDRIRSYELIADGVGLSAGGS